MPATAYSFELIISQSYNPVIGYGIMETDPVNNVIVPFSVFPFPLVLSPWLPVPEEHRL